MSLGLYNNDLLLWSCWLASSGEPVLAIDGQLWSWSSGWVAKFEDQAVARKTLLEAGFVEYEDKYHRTWFGPQPLKYQYMKYNLSLKSPVKPTTERNPMEVKSLQASLDQQADSNMNGDIAQALLPLRNMLNNLAWENRHRVKIESEGKVMQIPIDDILTAISNHLASVMLPTYREREVTEFLKKVEVANAPKDVED